MPGGTCFRYVTYAIGCRPNVKQQAEELKEIVKRNYPSAEMIVDFIGANELFESYNSIAETIINLPLVEMPIGLGKNKDSLEDSDNAKIFGG